MDARLNKVSMLIGGPGIALQWGGFYAAEFMRDSSVIRLGVVAELVGTVLLMVGLALFARAKARHPAWGLLGLLTIWGLIAFACIKDLHSEETGGS